MVINVPPKTAANTAGMKRAALSFLVWVCAFIYLLLTVTPDGICGFALAWQVSWLAGRGLCPPSLTKRSSGTSGVSSPLTVAGAALALRHVSIALLTKFPFRFHTPKRGRLAEHQAWAKSHFEPLHARWNSDTGCNRNASFWPDDGIWRISAFRPGRICRESLPSSGAPSGHESHDPCHHFHTCGGCSV